MKGSDPDEIGVRVVEDVQKSISPVADKPNETNDAPAGSVLHFILFFVLATFFVCLVLVFVTFWVKSMIGMVEVR